MRFPILTSQGSLAVLCSKTGIKVDSRSGLLSVENGCLILNQETTLNVFTFNFVCILKNYPKAQL